MTLFDKQNEDTESLIEEQNALNEQEYFLLCRQSKSTQFQNHVMNKFLKNYIIEQETIFLNRCRQDKTNMDTYLSLAQSTAVRKRDLYNHSQITTLLNTQRHYQEVNIKEKAACLALNDVIQDYEKQIENHQKRTGGAITCHSKHVSRIKKIRVLENRLNTATVQFNKLLTDNSLLREKIEHYRKERNVFNTLYKRSKIKLNKLKSQINTVVHSATQNYNARDDSRTKMTNLQERNDTDLNHFISDYKEMNRIIAQESKLQAFMNTKNSEKSELAFKEAHKRRLTYDNKTETLQEAEMVKFEKVLENIIKIVGNDQGNALKSIIMSNDNNKTKTTDLLSQIIPICERYKKTEEQNFSLFQFVNEMSQDVKRLQEKLIAIDFAKGKEKVSTMTSLQNSNNQVFQIKTNLRSSQELESVLVTKVEESMDDLLNLKQKVDNLFKKLDCDNSIISAKLNNTDNVTNDNVDLYLSAIENSINGLLESENFEKKKITLEEETNQNRIQSRENKKKPNKVGKKTKSISNTILPSVTDEHANEFIEATFTDLDSTILNRSALKSRAKVVLNDRARTRTAKSRERKNYQV